MTASDYFSLFGLKPMFAIDPAALEDSYFKAQREHHPDRYVARADAERRQAMQRSVDINLAYDTLKNPLKRAQYLLFLQGITVGTENDSVSPSTELLTETLEWREKVEENDDASALDAFDHELKDMIAQSMKTIGTLHSQSQWDKMAQETLRFSYLLKTQEAIIQKKYRLAS